MKKIQRQNRKKPKNIYFAVCISKTNEMTSDLIWRKMNAKDNWRWKCGRRRALTKEKPKTECKTNAKHLLVTELLWLVKAGEEESNCEFTIAACNISFFFSHYLLFIVNLLGKHSVVSFWAQNCRFEWNRSILVFFFGYSTFILIQKTIRMELKRQMRVCVCVWSGSKIYTHL